MLKKYEQEGRERLVDHWLKGNRTFIKKLIRRIKSFSYLSTQILFGRLQFVLLHCLLNMLMISANLRISLKHQQWEEEECFHVFHIEKDYSINNVFHSISLIM